MNNEQGTTNNEKRGKQMQENVIKEKSMKFAVRIVKLYQYLTGQRKEYVMSKQILKSGTSIGANASEAEQGQSKKDFTAKMQIALKEATETRYWLELLSLTEYISEKEYLSMSTDCKEIEKILTTIIKSSKKKEK